MAITYVGIALAAEAPWVLVMLIPATLVIQFGVIHREERYLERHRVWLVPPRARIPTGSLREAALASATAVAALAAVLLA